MSMFYARDGSEITMEQWGGLIANLDYKRVALTILQDGTRISTVWLGMDHGFGLTKGAAPIIFETMIFGEHTALADEQWRYATELQARDGHAHAVELAVAEYALHHADAEVSRAVQQEL